MKILMCASEMVPFAKTGGLADVVGALPIALEGLGNEVSVMLPFYKTIKDSNIIIQKTKQGFAYSTVGRNIKVYFIENDAYFCRDGLYGNKAGDYPDNLERFSYYSKRALEALKEINFKPDIIHIHDWQASLIPVYLKALFNKDAFYKKIKSILTIHNIGYQGLFAAQDFPRLGLDWGLFNIEGLEFYGKINILKGGIVFSDYINTVSPTYSKEMQSEEFGFGLEGLLRKRSGSVFGILNGLDYSIWKPETDKFIAKSYSFETIEDKYANKLDLQKLCAFSPRRDTPLFGIVSRLAQQKGFDILSEALETLCEMNIQLVILGTGDLKYHSILEGLVSKYPKAISLHLKFDDTLAHKIYAGSDIFLMPSKYEPCGLGQMISLRYGTIPLVFKTGGLADTVNKENGFVFADYSKDALIESVKDSIDAYRSKEKWLKLIRNAMKCDFSWKESAKEYVRLYEKARAR